MPDDRQVATKERPGAEETSEERYESLTVDPHIDEQDMEQRGLAALQDRRRLLGLLVAVVLLVVAIYFVLPKVVGLDDTIKKLGNATWYWVGIAIVANGLSFLAYMAIFRSVVGGAKEDEVNRRIDTRAAYQVTMAGFAATKIFSAAGAGGIALTYWALRKAGMQAKRAACRMVAFTVLLYAVYLLSLVVFGVLLETGAVPGESPNGGTIFPAAMATGAIVLLALTALIPERVERGVSTMSMRALKGPPNRWQRFLQRLAEIPRTLAMGVRTAGANLRHPRRGLSASLGAIGWWAGQIGTLWASFKAFGVEVPLAVVVQGFFIGMIANLAPSPAAGVGTVDAGLIGAFALFGIPIEAVFPALLTFRLIGFWLPIPFGIAAFVQLRNTVRRWERERGGYTIKSKVTAEAT
jgi:uncharacterized protein (TIRG00374 family)